MKSYTYFDQWTTYVLHNLFVDGRASDPAGGGGGRFGGF